MAEIFPDEGLDHILGIWPKGAANDSVLDLCLFSSQTASTVIGSGEALVNITESAWTNYAEQALGSATWGAVGAGASGRSTTYPQVTFPTVGATGGTVNGFYITDAGDTLCVCQANFDDTTAVVLAENDVIKVTPTIEFLN